MLQMFLLQIKLELIDEIYTPYRFLASNSLKFNAKFMESFHHQKNELWVIVFG